MKRKTLVSKPPKPFKVSLKAEVNLEGWISYLKGLSHRVRIKRPSDNDFNLDYYKSITIKCLTSNNAIVSLDGWPKENEVAFLVSFDSSLPGHKEEYLVKNSYLFCFHDFAFGLAGYFELEGHDDENPPHELYSVYNVLEDALRWKRTASKIKIGLEQIEKSVTSLSV